MRKLNLGSGRNKHKDCINIDINPNTEPDIVRDIEKGLPFEDNSVDEVIAEHFLEHVKDIQPVMFEILRVLKPGGFFKAVVPIGKGLTNSPFHKTLFDEKSWIFFTDWNVPEDSGYDFKLVEEGVRGNELTKELWFTLSAVK